MIRSNVFPARNPSNLPRFFDSPLKISLRFGLALFGIACALQCADPRQYLISAFSQDYEVEGDASTLAPVFTERDSGRARIRVGFTEVARGMPMITDIQFVPAAKNTMFVAAKTGELYVATPGEKTTRPRLVERFEVTTESEQGLLGIALHPDFRVNGLMYFNYTVKKGGRDISRVAERTFTNPGSPVSKGKLEQERVLMEVEQPYQNHNAGQLAVGPDGMLYVGWGDGGWREDPKRHGQNPQTLLGAMLRIDPRPEADGSRAYRIPDDNPFAAKKGARPEIFAIGLRNPWRYSFSPRGRLIVADVGQDKLEEIAIVGAGENHGWDIREARACHRPKEGCAKTGAAKEPLVDPVYEYGRDDGRSITGGYVYTGSRIRALKGRYVFGDFVTGRIWAITLPEDGTSFVPPAKSHALGKWPILISTFGRDPRGEIYVADFGGGKVYRLDPK